MAAKQKKQEPTGRQLPEIPPLEALLSQSAETLLTGRPLEDALIENIDLSPRKILSISARDSVFRNLSFAHCEIGALHLRDVRFVKCDLSNSIPRGFEATRVEFIDCRLTGMRAVECRWNSVLIENCEGRYTQLNDAQLRNCEFRGSQFAECDLRGSDLEATIFAHTSLQRADLTGAKLKFTDLRGADIDGVIAQAGDVRGAIVSASQAMDLARLLGLVIR